MTLRLLGAAGAIAVAMALEPTSFDLANPQGRRPDGAPAQGLTQPSAPATAPPFGSTTLSMVPAPKDPKVVARLQRMLPIGMTVEDAATGFPNQASFIAAVQLSHNLDIPFEQMKSKVVRDGLSLGQAIQTLRPEADVSREFARVREIASR